MRVRAYFTEVGAKNREVAALLTIRIMEDFILCKAENGAIIEVDIDDDGTVGLETLKSLFGDKASALTYTNPSTGRERVVRVLEEKLVEPKGDWGTSDRIYLVSYGCQDTRTQ